MRRYWIILSRKDIVVFFNIICKYNIVSNGECGKGDFKIFCFFGNVVIGI